MFLTSQIFGETVGGVEMHLFYLSDSLRRHGLEIEIVAPTPTRAAHGIDEIEYQGNKITRLLIRSRLTRLFDWLARQRGSGWFGMACALLVKLRLNMYASRVNNYVRTNQFDIVHQHDYLAQIVTSKCIARHTPVVWTNHQGEYLLLDRYRLARVLQKYLIRHYSEIIAPSRELKPRLANATYIPNGVNTQLFRADSGVRARRRADLEIKDEQVLFLCPRRWAPTKGLIYLARAMRLLPSPITERAVFAFAGNDNRNFPRYSREVNEELSKYLGRTILLGDVHHDQLPSLYQAADVVVIPSLLEATSLAALEAMSCSVPVLASRVGGLPDIVTNNETGWLVPARDPTSLAAKISEIVEMPALCRRAGHQAGQKIRCAFGWDQIALLTLEKYKRAKAAGLARAESRRHTARGEPEK